MFNINQFLTKINNHRLKELVIRQDIVLIIKEVLGFDLDVKDINIRNNTIFLKNINQVQKNELYIKKQKVLNKINEKISGNFSDIK